jgi:Immunity protein 63
MFEGNTMEKLSLPALAARFHSMAEHLNVEQYYKTFHTSPQHDGAPHVELKSGKFEFVVTERGSELERISGLDTDEVLYLMFAGITATMATSYEARNRKPSGDGRAVWFPYQEELMERLEPQWGVRLKTEHQRILQTYPFTS